MVDGRRRWIAVWVAAAALLALALTALRLWQEPGARIAWRYTPTGSRIDHMKLYLRPQGGCYAVAATGQIYVFDADGTLLKQCVPTVPWSFATGVLDNQGNLYLPRFDKKVLAYNPEGEELWACDIGSQGVFGTSQYDSTTLTLGLDGKLYAATDQGEFTVLTCEGTIDRRFDVRQELSEDARPVIAPEGGFYLLVNLRDPVYHHITNEVVRISGQGQVLWRRQVAQKRLGSLYSSASGDVCGFGPYFITADRNSRFYVYNADNSERFTYINPDPLPPDGYREYSAKYDADSTLFVVSDSRITAFDPGGAQSWSQHFPGKCSTTFTSQDRLFVLVTLLGKSQVDSWVSQLKYRKIKLPIPRGGYPRLLYVLDKASGRIIKRYKLGKDTLPVCGPGPQGEFYGYHATFRQASYGYDYELLRIDLN